MKSDIFNTELDYIKNPNYRESAKVLLELLPDYFYEIAASTTGKYHPKFALGEQGLVRHTKVAVLIAHTLLENNSIGHSFNEKEKDLMLIALLLHDGLKKGKEDNKYSVHDHPIIAANFARENQNQTKLTSDEIEFIASVIESHMGEWNTNKYSDVILPVPNNKYQRFVHMADYLASRRFIDVEFEGNNIVLEGKD